MFFLSSGYVKALFGLVGFDLVLIILVWVSTQLGLVWLCLGLVRIGFCYVWILLCLGFVMFGFCYVEVWLGLGLVRIGFVTLSEFQLLGILQLYMMCTQKPGKHFSTTKAKNEVIIKLNWFS